MKSTVFSVLLMVGMASSAGIGDRLVRTFTRFVNLPITTETAEAQGWKKMEWDCDPHLGMAYVNATVGLGRHEPTILYYTQGGQISGISVDVFGAKTPPENLVQKGFFAETGVDEYRIAMGFRGDPCGMGVDMENPIGDRVVVAPSGPAVSLPLTKSEAEQGKWKSGSCFAGMGTHYFYDLVSAPDMTWNASNLLPVVTMFNNNNDLQAVFFASSNVQQQAGDPNNWEPQFLPNPLMCMNTCDPACTFSGTDAWSTYHVYFREQSQATCSGNCTLACCPP